MIVTGGGLGDRDRDRTRPCGGRRPGRRRNQEPGRRRAHPQGFPTAEAAALDLADLRSVRAFCDGWSGPVAAVVANAGVMAPPERQVSAQGWEMQLAINYLGHFALVHGLHDALRAAEEPRVVVVSSGAQRLYGFDFDDPQFERRPYDPMAAYAQSKTADVLLAVGISRRWARDGIVANSFEPGWIHTNLTRHLSRATMQAVGAMDEEGNLLTPDYYKTPAQGRPPASCWPPHHW
ncbi:SDR family NAD(P)-dependent oxidoreductase [Kitasatospora aburaviensis]